MAGPRRGIDGCRRGYGGAAARRGSPHDRGVARMAAGDGLAAAPFVLTLELDGESFGRLNELRRLHYPPERNLVPAHVTLFHQLPGDRGREIKALLRMIAAEQEPIEIPPGE